MLPLERRLASWFETNLKRIKTVPTFDDKIDNATHAAFNAAGLFVSDHHETADTLHDIIAGLFNGILMDVSDSEKALKEHANLARHRATSLDY